MIKRLVLHIGLPKTATSSLQSYLWNGRNKMKEVSILYPESCLFHDRSHHPLFFEVEGINAWHTSKSPEHSYLRDLQEEVELYNPETVILSSEVVPNFSPKRILNALKPALGGWLQIDLLVAFRNVFAFSFSGYLQKIKDPVIGHTSTFADYFESPAALRDFSGAVNWYRSSQIFPYNFRFITEFFDPKLSRVPFLDYFTDLAGLDLGSNEDLHVNKSPSIQKHLLYLAANRRSKGDAELRRTLHKQINKLFAYPSGAKTSSLKDLQERCENGKKSFVTDTASLTLPCRYEQLESELSVVVDAAVLENLFSPISTDLGLLFDELYSSNRAVIESCLDLAERIE